MMQGKFFFILSVFFSFAGCESNNDQEINQPKIAIYCILKANEFPEARLEYTRNISDTTTYRIYSENGSTVNQKLICSTAKIFLFENNILVDSMLFNSETFLYQGAKHIVKSRGKYRIEIRLENSPIISATTIIPDPISIVDLDTLTLDYDSVNNYSIMRIKLSFEDSSSENNYYELSGNRLNIYDSQYSWIPISFSSSGVYENIPSQYGYTLAYFSDKLFNGKTIILEIKNPNLGSDKNGFYIYSGDSILSFKLANVSIEEAMYQKSIDQWGYNKNNAFYQPVPIYCNINNAAGIFAGVSETSDTIILR